MIKYDEDGNEVNTGSYWGFIETYHPNYGSDEICDSNDFSLWLEDERTEPPMGLEDCIKNEVAVFEKALRNYIKLRKEDKMKTYEITYWEQETVWVKRRTIVKTDKDLNKAIEYGDEVVLKDVIEGNAVDYVEADYDWETVEHEDYDFSEVVVEEVENDEE